MLAGNTQRVVNNGVVFAVHIYSVYYIYEQLERVCLVSDLGGPKPRCPAHLIALFFTTTPSICLVKFKNGREGFSFGIILYSQNYTQKIKKIKLFIETLIHIFYSFTKP